LSLKLILAVIALFVGIAFIITGIIPNQVTTYSLNPQTGTFQQSSFPGGELFLIYTFSKG
jgi:hypothetical protein